MIKKNLFRVFITMVMMLAVTANANAQLKGLLNKAKKVVKEEVQNSAKNTNKNNSSNEQTNNTSNENSSTVEAENKQNNINNVSATPVVNNKPSVPQKETWTMQKLFQPIGEARSNLRMTQWDKNSSTEVLELNFAYFLKSEIDIVNTWDKKAIAQRYDAMYYPELEELANICASKPLSFDEYTKEGELFNMMMWGFNRLNIIQRKVLFPDDPRYKTDDYIRDWEAMDESKVPASLRLALETFHGRGAIWAGDAAQFYSRLDYVLKLANAQTDEQLKQMYINEAVRIREWGVNNQVIKSEDEQWTNYSNQIAALGANLRDFNTIQAERKEYNKKLVAILKGQDGEAMAARHEAILKQEKEQFNKVDEKAQADSQKNRIWNVGGATFKGPHPAHSGNVGNYTVYWDGGQPRTWSEGGKTHYEYSGRVWVIVPKKLNHAPYVFHSKTGDIQIQQVNY